MNEPGYLPSKVSSTLLGACAVVVIGGSWWMTREPSLDQPTRATTQRSESVSARGVVSELASNELLIGRQTSGKAWPFSISEGVLSCTDNQVTLTHLDGGTRGRTYAINGWAANTAAQNGWGKIDEIWSRSKPIDDVISKGLSLC